MITNSLDINESAQLLVEESNRLVEKGDIAVALKFCEEALANYPHIAILHNQKGFILAKLKRFEEALQCYNHSLLLNPLLADTYFKRGNVFKNIKVYESAIGDYKNAITLDNEHAKAWFNLGVVYQLSSMLNEALECYNKALQIKPDYPGVLNNMGNLLKNLDRFEEAISSYDQAIKFKNTPEVHYNKALAFQGLGRYEDSLEAYGQAIKLKSDYAEAYNNIGSLLHAMHRLSEAGAAFDKAISIRNDYPEAWNNFGNLLKDMGQYEKAIACYHESLKLKPDIAEVWVNVGMTLQKLERLHDAVASYDHAIKIKPDIAEAWFLRGNALRELKQLDNAIDSYAKAITIKPFYPEAFGSWLQAKMHACDWQGIQTAFENIDTLVLNGAPVVPFNLLATPSSSVIQKRCAENFVRDKISAEKKLTGPSTRYKHERIKLGYFSADLHNHATAYLMAELFEKHDKSKFELIAFSFGPAQKDEMRQRIRASFDQFHDVRKQSDEDIAQLAKSVEIDIAIDLKGYTRGARPKVFAMCPAPIQVNYLGYPGTMGADFIDYLIADPVLIPEPAREHYTEKIAYVPDTYQVNDRNRIVSSRLQTRADHNLPSDAFVFCCFNNNFKITPDVFEIWMRILARVGNSVLWLFEANPSAMQHLLMAAERHGIPASRLVFAKKMPQAKHLARYRHADLVLDTFHYNAHTTTSDALWVGTPVLTCIGATFAGRVAASLLTAHGVTELITQTPQAYEAVAIELAQNPEALANIRQKVIAHRDTHPLFDTSRFTRNIEAAYLRMYQRHQCGLAPDHIELTP